MEYKKVQSPAKVVVTRKQGLNKKVLETLGVIADIVGATLGPGGQAVLIERQEYGMPGLVTKDGVTVFRSLGFNDPVAHSVMESARDAAVRTVGEAGDGTTTATILAEALARFASQYLEKHPTESPQKVVREIQALFKSVVEPIVKTESVEADFGTEEGKRLLHAVATVSANGDTELADAVIKCFDLVGDGGNVSIVEQSGPSQYIVERIEGYPIPIGYEESCMKFFNAFVNDAGNQRVFMDKPYYVLYHGAVNEIQTLVGLLDRIQGAWMNIPGTEYHDESRPRFNSPNVVLVATGFSESVIGSLALNWTNPNSINVLPVLTPRTPIMNGELHLLEDLAAITGATVLNPLSAGFDTVSYDLREIGQTASFEMYRFRSTVVGHNDPEEVEFRAEELEAQIKTAESELDRRILQERLGKVTGGIAKLRVVGASNGELREKKDRADDAVSAVRGAMKSGVLPGGGWMLRVLAEVMKGRGAAVIGPDVGSEILAPAFMAPVERLYLNSGMSRADIGMVDAGIVAAEDDASLAGESRHTFTYDCLNMRVVDAFRAGLLDSTPAVLEAIRNSISIASLLGTLGGVVVFQRDDEFERMEGKATADFMRDIELGNTNPANQRA